MKTPDFRVGSLADMPGVAEGCPLHPAERTLPAWPVISVKCQEQTYAILP
jgi:hypothetical protein